MKKKILFLGIPALALVLSLVFAGCSNSTGSDNGNLSAELKEPRRIKVYTGISIPMTANSPADGFTVTVNGVLQPIYCTAGSGYMDVAIWMINDIPAGDIRVFYDGTGVYAGLQPFSNLAVSR
jgi:hypothetical protein